MFNRRPFLGCQCRVEMYSLHWGNPGAHKDLGRAGHRCFGPKSNSEIVSCVACLYTIANLTFTSIANAISTILF